MADFYPPQSFRGNTAENVRHAPQGHSESVPPVISAMTFNVTDEIMTFNVTDQDMEFN